jgi:hypothetical protein
MTGASPSRILRVMSQYRAARRRHLATSPFNFDDPEPPAETFSVAEQVTHDKYGLGTIMGVEPGIALVIDFGSHVQRIMTPSAKLTKL